MISRSFHTISITHTTFTLKLQTNKHLTLTRVWIITMNINLSVMLLNLLHKNMQMYKTFDSKVAKYIQRHTRLVTNLEAETAGDTANLQ